MPQLSAGVLGLTPQNPVPPSFMQMMTKPWHCGVLASPAQGSVKTLLCQALVAPLSLAALVQFQWSGSWQGSCWARSEWEILPPVHQRTEGSSLVLPQNCAGYF